MFKLVFLVAVLVVAVASASPHPRQAHPKKPTGTLKHATHHGLEPHKRSPVRAARSHGAVHKTVHHSPGESVHHYSKPRGVHGIHNVHGGKHKRNQPASHHPVKHQGHRK